MSKKTTKEVQEELWKRFPNLNLLEDYKGANEKTKIKCTNCDYEWSAIPRSVIKSKWGCPKCGDEESRHKKSLKLFTSKLDLNRYEIIDFKSYTDVTIKCKICGNIRHTTCNNILRFGCKTCSQRNTTDDFIKRAKEVHGDFYNYSKVEYKDIDTKVCIICPEHGEFWQTPKKHIYAKQNCPKCSGKDWNTELFIQKAKEVHKNKYDYSKTEYVDFKTKVCIICPKHGEFWQIPYTHIKVECGCPSCKSSKGEEKVNYILQNIPNIKYIRQKSIVNPYLNNKFIVDFYIEYNNKIYIIEFNGEQHYKPIKQFGGDLAFKKQQQRDTMLRQYCLENNINLLEIRFDNNNIKQTIENLLLPCDQVIDHLLEDKIGESCDADTELTILDYDKAN